MPSDPSKPLLWLFPSAQTERPKGRPKFPSKPSAFSTIEQEAKFDTQFKRLAEVLARDATGLELRSDPAALAPERLLVFEIRGSVRDFAKTIKRVVGLELIDEDELAGDESDEAPALYLMVPDLRALAELLSLWTRWQAGTLVTGQTQWGEVFGLLRALRTWGPRDRINGAEANMLAEEIEGRAADETVSLEIELVYRRDNLRAEACESEVKNKVSAANGKVIARARIEAIAYHALLVSLPVAVIRNVLALEGIAHLDPIMHIRPQSTATVIEVADTSKVSNLAVTDRDLLGSPLLALLDGVPIAAHPLLQKHLIVDDQFDLEPNALVQERRHGTAMASLIIHGDRNLLEPPLPKLLHVVPVLGAKDHFPDDRLVVDLIYQAIVNMLDGTTPTAPNVLLVNLSLGNSRRPFHGQLSPWARLIDRLAYHYGLLFLVSAGNICQPLAMKSFATLTAFEDLAKQARAEQVLIAVDAGKAERRLFSPAETVNGLTVGAVNIDHVSVGRRNIDPYGELIMSNPSSALGPGFANSVKPDVLMPGSREHLSLVHNKSYLFVKTAAASRFSGLKVAAPSSDGENYEGYTNGTSGACALASRTCHRIHDALEATYGADFMQLPKHQRAALMKALFVHSATWPEATAEFIRQTVGPADRKRHVQQKDNIRRFLGFGVVNAEYAVACAADRATFWACGQLERDKVATIEIPIPLVFGAKARPHSLSATLAWMTPASPGRRSYRCVRLKLTEPSKICELGIKAHGDQPDTNQTNRGTVFTRRWTGAKAAAVSEGMSINLVVQRDPDQGVVIDEPISFGLAVTLAMPGVVEIYEQVRLRLQLAQRLHIQG